MTRQSEHRRRAPVLVLALAYASAVCSAVIAITGGARVEVLGVTLAAGYPYRSMLIACVAFALYLFRWRRSLRADTETIMEVPATIVLAGARSWWTALALSAAILFAGVSWGSMVAGGSDSYGYVSQAALWRQGRLVTRLDIIDHVPWPEAGRTFAPLGYRPGTSDATIVPTYPPGLPLLMALGQMIGYCGAFLVVPLCGAAVIGLTYALGRRLFRSPGIALWAAILVATSPVFLFQLMQPMSDVPAAAAWTLALLLVTIDCPAWAGLAMAATMAIRPNLVLLPLSLLAWSVLREARARDRGWRPDATRRLVAGLLPGAVGIAWFNEHLYGSPLSTGYGSPETLYAWGRAAANLTSYAAWTIGTQTPLVLFAAVYFLAPRLFPLSIALPRILLGGTIAAVVLSYLFYLSFDAWWFLRFLLPMWPVIMLLMAAGLDVPLRVWLTPVRPVVAAVCVLFFAWHGIQISQGLGVFDFGLGERQYVHVARFVDARTDPAAVIVSSQHSGSIRQYAGRVTLRFDSLDEGWLDGAVRYLDSIGRRPYFVLQDSEIDQFRRRFSARNRLGALDWPAMAVLEEPNLKVSMFDPIDRRSGQTPMPIPSDVGGEGRLWHCEPPAPLAASLR